MGPRLLAAIRSLYSGGTCDCSEGLAERLWAQRWLNQVIEFMHCLSNMPQDGIHAEISTRIKDNIADAQEHPSCGR